jgi:hypothetical protein
MAVKTFADDDVLSADDINTYLAGEGGAWSTWTPRVRQPHLPLFTGPARWAKYGRFVLFQANLSCVSVPSWIELPANADPTFTLPVQASSRLVSVSGLTPTGFVIGRCLIEDDDGPAYRRPLSLTSATTVTIPTLLTPHNFRFGLTDTLQMSGYYEAAT